MTETILDALKTSHRVIYCLLQQKPCQRCIYNTKDIFIIHKKQLSMKRKITEEQLRSIIKEAVMNEINLMPQYKKAEDKPELGNPESHLRRLGDEVLKVIHNYCKGNGIDYDSGKLPYLLQPVIKEIIYGK